MKSFAIVVACYNRIEGIKRLLKSIEDVNYAGRKDITLILSVDNSGSDKVVNFANEYEWPHGEKIVRTFEQRQGLRKHILQCGDYTENFEIVVILEDDIFVSESMYYYAYGAAEKYGEDDRVAGISLFGFQKNWLNWIYRFEPLKTEYDAYFLKIAQSWGQVWTKSKWQDFMTWYKQNIEFSFDPNLPQYLFTWPDSSWLKYHDRYCIEKDKYFVYPYVSLTTNFSDAGTHNNRTINDHQVELQFGKCEYRFPDLCSDSVLYDEYMNPKGLEKNLNLADGSLCVDFYGTKPYTLWEQADYLLTTQQIQNYQMVQSFALSLRPLEAAVIKHISGQGIYLYQIKKGESPILKKGDKNELLSYELRTHDGKQLLPFAIHLVTENIGIKLKKLIKRYIKR